MDTVPRRRRAGGTGEPEGNDDVPDIAYQTALSQTVASAPPPGMIHRGEASPGTLEMGGATGRMEAEQLPTANPFHSERVRAEVELIRNRPATLDQDGHKIRGDVDETALGDAAWGSGATEPNYADALGATGSGQEAPRVARIETSPGTVRPQEGFSELAKGNEPRAAPQGNDSGSREPLSALDTGCAVGPAVLSSAEDDRELVPVESDRISRVEFLLTQVLEENRSLKRQLQAESNSSWHSTRTPGEIPASPASFGLNRHFPEAVTSALLSVHSVGANAPRDLPGAFGDLSSSNWTVGQGPELSQSLARARFQQAPAENLYGLTSGSEGYGSLGLSERVAAGMWPVASDSGVPVAPAPPLVPIPSVGVGALDRGEPPQSLRQFASAALQGCPTAGEGVNAGFHTPRSGGGSGRFDSEGYPLSPGGTSIKPPSIPPPVSPRAIAAPAAVPFGLPSAPSFPGGPREALGSSLGPPGSLRGLGDLGFPSAGCGTSGVPGVPGGGFGASGPLERPEEPAKYISELPKLVQTDLASSAVVCGNWLAQVRQVLVGLSPSAGVWWQGVEGPATVAYRKWLVADPLGRLSIDPSSVVGEFDRNLYGRVESRSVSLLLAEVPQSLRDDVVTNRWLSSASILFRVLCLFQPGGSSERSHLLSQLVNPGVCGSLTTR